MLQTLLKGGSKLLTGGNIETNCVSEAEGKVIHRLSHLGIHRIYSHQRERERERERDSTSGSFLPKKTEQLS